MEPNNYKKYSEFYIGGERISEIKNINAEIAKRNRDTEGIMNMASLSHSDHIDSMCSMAQMAAMMFGAWEERTIPQIAKVIFNDPATIVLWNDGTKTVVKAQNEVFDKEKGLAMAIAKKAMGNRGNYFEEFKKWTV